MSWTFSKPHTQKTSTQKHTRLCNEMNEGQATWIETHESRFSTTLISALGSTLVYRLTTHKHHYSFNSNLIIIIIILNEREKKNSLPSKDNLFEVKKNTDNKIFGYMQNWKRTFALNQHFSFVRVRINGGSVFTIQLHVFPWYACSGQDMLSIYRLQSCKRSGNEFKVKKRQLKIFNQSAC